MSVNKFDHLTTTAQGVTWSMHHDSETKKITLKASQDVKAILDNNQRLYNENDGWSESREWRRVATIPDIVWLEYWNRGINIYAPEHRKELRKLLNDPDFLKLRTASGRL